jgi:hypothetical protein
MKMNLPAGRQVQMKAFALPVPLRRDWIHRTLYKRESHCVHRILVFPIAIGIADAMVTDCKLLVDLWSENQNELCQL